MELIGKADHLSSSVQQGVQTPLLSVQGLHYSEMSKVAAHALSFQLYRKALLSAKYLVLPVA